MTELRYNSTQH